MFVLFCVKVRHSPLFPERKPSFYLHHCLQIKDIMSFSLPNVDKSYKKAKLKLQGESGNI